MSQAITEEQGIHKQWYEDAKKVSTLDELMAFVKHVTTDYDHDYGTICHAVASAALAAAWCVDRSGQGGITGFQAGAIMWEFITHWNHQPDDLLGLTDYGNILYPQYDDKFGTVPADFVTKLKEKAQANLSEFKGAHPEVVARWRAVAAGDIPFPVRDD